MTFPSKIKRKLFFIFSLFKSVFLVSQVPAYIPYQAIAREGSGLAKTNTAIQVQFRIFNSITSPTASYHELHSVTTNDFGYFNLRIGAGNVQSGGFGNILWSGGDVSYEVWLDLGTGLTQLGGRSGFMSVPYALYAANSSPSPTLTINAPNTVSNTAAGVYNIEVPGPSISINAPNTINTISPGVFNIQIPSPSLSISNYSLSISNGNTVALPGNYSAGAGIAINGSVISNSQPNQTVTISGNAVNGTYPSYSINNQSLALSGNTLSLSNSNTVNLSGFATTVTQGTNIIVAGSAPNYTVSAISPSLTVTGNANISGAYPTPTINVPPQTLSIAGNNLSLSGNGGSVMLPATTSITQSTNILVTGAAPNYSISAITPTLSTIGNANISGAYPTQTITVQPQILSVTGNSLLLSGNGGSVTLPTQSLSISGNTVSLSNGGGSVNISTAAWSPGGNSGTNPTTNYIGTSDPAGLSVRTNGLERFRVTGTGFIGFGTATPAAFFDVDYGNVKLGFGSTPLSTILHGTVIATGTVVSGNNIATLNIPGALVGDMLLLTHNYNTASSQLISISNAYVSSAGVVTCNLYLNQLVASYPNTSVVFSYLIIRP